MTEAKAAETIRDSIRACLEGAVPVKCSFDTFDGTMLIEGMCDRFADMAFDDSGSAGFTFVQSGFRYGVAVVAHEQRPLH